MSDLLERLRALRGETAPTPATVAPSADARYEGPAAQLGATSVSGADGVHLLRQARLEVGARHGRVPLGGAGLHPWLLRHAGAAGEPDTSNGRVLYVDTETTGLSGGTGTFAFLIGVGVHDADGFHVAQLFLPGPEHERSQLAAFAALARGARAVVTYNGASFDLPLLRARYALHDLDDPLAGVPHLDLLGVARRLWRERLPDCTLGTVERDVLGAHRSHRDVPGFEVPERYFAYLRSRDALGLRGVMEHNRDDIAALAALRTQVELLLSDPSAADAGEAHALGRWLERLGEADEALARYSAAAPERREAAWRASLLLRRLGRIDEAVLIWELLAEGGEAGAWVELAKVQEHRWRDFEAAIASVDAAARCVGCEVYALDKRRERLVRRAGASAVRSAARS